MQVNITAARPYAQAAFELAREDNDLGAWSDMLNLINMVVSDPQMQSMLHNPTIKTEFLANLVIDICGHQLTDKGRNFVRTLAAARRLTLAPQIYNLYEQSRTQAEGVVEVVVNSAYPLGDSDIKMISESMQKRLGKKITISTKIDEKLIGGVVIRAGDSVIDASVLGRLKHLGSQLAE